VESGTAKQVYSLAMFLCLLGAVPVAGQQSLDTSEVPSQFKLDMETAARGCVHN
jgi:hypothetical protein